MTQSLTEHKCQYCGAMTTQSDDECYKNPNNKQTEESWDDIVKNYNQYCILHPMKDGAMAFQTWIQLFYHPPINKNIIQEKMYSK